MPKLGEMARLHPRAINNTNEPRPKPKTVDGTLLLAAVDRARDRPSPEQLWVHEIVQLHEQLSPVLSPQLTVDRLMDIVRELPDEKPNTRVAVTLQVIVALERAGWKLTR